ncbi:MAG: hypothetical protein M5U34_13110 [Chloroflexi bacterium]|nr:hypothetical protein [Chloroflexota bacterium]
MAQMRALYRLQQIDAEIKETKSRLLAVLTAQKEPEALAKARDRVETAVAILQKQQAQRKRYQTELDDLNAKTKRSEDRLYSGKVKNPKELKDLQSEIKSLGRRREALEDDILETMVLIEDAEGEKLAAEEVLFNLEAERETALPQLAQEQKRTGPLTSITSRKIAKSWRPKLNQKRWVIMKIYANVKMGWPWPASR